MPSPLQISLKVTGLDQAKADLQTFAQGGKRSFEELAADARRLSSDSLQTDRALSGVANRVRAMAAEFDPAATASLRFRNSLTDIERAQRANIITAGQAATLTAALRAQHENLVATNSRVVASTGQVRFAVQTLGFQLNDIATSLASGGSPMRVLAQQSGQVVQAFQQGGGVSTVLGAVGTAIRGWITPTTAAVAGVGALAAGFGVLLARASSNADELRRFNLILQGTGRDSLVTAANLQQVVRQLRDVGVSRDDANAAVSAIARNPRLNPAQAGRIADIGLAVGQRLGLENPAQGIEQFTGAIQGGVESVLKLGFQLNALTADEAVNIREMARHGQQAEALRQAIASVEKNVGSYRDTLTETQKAINALSSAWRDFIDKSAESAPIQNTLRELKGILELINRLDSAVFGTSRQTGASAVDWRAERNALIRGGNPAAGNYPGLTLSPGGALIRSMIGVESGFNPNAVSPAGAMGLMQIMPGTARGLGLSNPFDPVANVAAGSRYIEQLVREFGNLENGLMAYNWGPGNMRSALSGQRGIPAGVRGYAASVLSGAGLTGRETSSDLFLPDADRASQSAVAVRALTEAEAKRTEIARLWGPAQQVANAREQEYQRALAETGDKTLALERAEIAAAGARERANIELAKAATVQDAQTAALLKSAEAFRVSEAAGYRVLAEEQARIEVMQRGGDVAQRTQQILEESAATAIQSGQRQIAAAGSQIAALERLAGATRDGAAAAHDQEIRNQAALATQDALAKAEASRNPVLIEQAKALTEAALAEAKRADAARQAIQINTEINRRNDQIAVVQLATGLQGQTPEVIAAATEHLKEQQRLIASGRDLNEDIAKASLASVDALSEANAQWAEAVRRQQRVEEGVRSIADTIENTLTRSIEDAFSGRKVESWGERIKSMLGSLVSSLSSTLFLRPLTGTVLGALGFGGLAQQYGGFGGGGVGGLFGTGSAAASGGGGSIWSLLSGASSISSLSGGGLFSSTGGFLDKIGSSLGFGGGGLFGDLTLGQALGSAGAGFGAGSLLNSLLGGNTLTGTIGSGIGSLAGSLIPSALGFSLGPLGGILGGALGGLFGLFGNNRPSANESAGTLNIGTGAIGALVSHGDAASSAQVKQFTDTISSFTKAIQSTTGGSLAGTINPVFSQRDGLRLNYDILGYGAGSYTASSVDDAINVAKLATARSLQGVTDTVRTVVNAVSDPADLDAAIQFAATYDKIAEAAKSAFASIPGDLSGEGPFKQAKDQIVALLGPLSDIAQNAQKFGLSLDPVNAALAEATRRLTEDFNRNIQDQITAIENPAQSLVEIEKRTWTARINEALAAGGDLTQVYRLNLAEMNKLWENATAGIKTLAADLSTGSLSGLTPARSVSAANDNFLAAVGAVRGGDLNRIGELDALGRDVITQAMAAYGNAPQTGALRASVLAAIDSVLAKRSFAGGTDYTPPGAIIVGERGPELLYQRGGMAVAPNWGGASGGREFVAELRALRTELAALLNIGNRIAQGAAAETIRRLDARIAQSDRAPLVEPPRRKVA